MALLMVHLLTAQKWAQAHEEYRNNPEFYLGAISPDALHIRFGGDKSRKNHFHLNNWLSPSLDDVLAYWKAHHSPFDIGYGIHVMTDAQWVPRFRSRFPQLLLPSGHLDVGTYYNDTFIADFSLHEDGGRELLELLMKAQAPEDHPLLTKEEFEKWREETVQIYSGQCPKSDPVKYIDREYVDAFIEDAQDLFCRVYEAYERGEETWRF